MNKITRVSRSACYESQKEINLGRLTLLDTTVWLVWLLRLIQQSSLSNVAMLVEFLFST